MTHFCVTQDPIFSWAATHTRSDGNAIVFQSSTGVGARDHNRIRDGVTSEQQQRRGCRGTIQHERSRSRLESRSAAQRRRGLRRANAHRGTRAGRSRSGTSRCGLLSPVCIGIAIVLILIIDNSKGRHWKGPVEFAHRAWRTENLATCP
jgi:hypothetical protein